MTTYFKKCTLSKAFLKQILVVGHSKLAQVNQLFLVVQLASQKNKTNPNAYPTVKAIIAGMFTQFHSHYHPFLTTVYNITGVKAQLIIYYYK